MALFGNFSKSGKLNINWGLSSEKQERQPPLYEVAEKTFGKDKKLMMFIGMFLKGCRERHRYPTRQAWTMQLAMLERLSAKERINSVEKAVRYGWNGIVYENEKKSQNTVTREKEDKNDILNVGF